MNNGERFQTDEDVPSTIVNEEEEPFVCQKLGMPI